MVFKCACLRINIIIMWNIHINVHQTDICPKSFSGNHPGWVKNQRFKGHPCLHHQVNPNLQNVNTKLSASLIKHHSMKLYWQNSIATSCVISLSIIQWWTVGLTLQPLYSQGRRHCCSLDRRLCESQGQPWNGGNEKSPTSTRNQSLVIHTNIKNIQIQSLAVKNNVSCSKAL
jgi:hypothetical protein